MMIKCKMCGGDLHPAEGASTCTCEFCGSVQTIPKLDNERRMNLYDRGNHFRRQNEYDKAMGIFEKILQDDRTDAEAYWSLVLCRWGIEYVEDPATKKRLPTVNRVQLTSILKDEDYLSALQYADGVQKSIYQQEARAIDEIQKGILAISRNEKPFDVFICYKETDEGGRRTPDSVLANDLYHQLTNEGFKVFFSRITLEDKIGTAYEPYIFAALQSARVMVVLGTKKEYFQAVWVKNEWSRYLAMIRGGEKKTLVPAYRDMDPYDLPDEFSHLQAQDMGRLGFMQDLIRGIKKILGEEKPAAPVQQVVVQQAAPAEGMGNISALLDRAFMALEDGNFDRADDFCEQVLNQDARNARAYLGKLMASLHVKRPEGLARLEKPFDHNEDYKKVLRFGDEALKNQVLGWRTEVIERLQRRQRQEQERKEQERKNKLREKFSSRVKAAETLLDIQKIKEETAEIQPERLAEEIRQACDVRQAEILDTMYQKAQKMFREEKWQDAECAFRRLEDYEDSREMAARCQEIYRKERYEEAESLMERTSYKQAEGIFSSLGDYRDSREKMKQCREMLRKKMEEAEEVARRRKQAAEAAAARKKRITLLAGAMIVLGIVAFVVFEMVFAPMYHYNKAEKLLKEEKFNMALEEFGLFMYYKDVPDRIDETYYKKGEAMLAAGNWENAVVAFKYAGSYKDAAERKKEVFYKKGEALLAAGDEEGAIAAFKSVEDFSDAAERWKGAYYAKAEQLLAAGDNVGAMAFYQKVGNYRDSMERQRSILSSLSGKIGAGYAHLVGLKADGTVETVGLNYFGRCNVDGWTDIVAISAGNDHTVGLNADGTVVAVGNNVYGQCNVKDWTEIVAIFAGATHTVGLKADGTVVAAGRNSDGQCNVSDWTDIVAISAGTGHTVGLKADGTVMAVGKNYEGRCDVQGWTDIVAISAGNDHTVGLKADSTVVAVGSNFFGQCNVQGWTDIVAISAGTEHTVGLKADGTVVAVGSNDWGQCNVSSWRDIVAVSAGEDYTVGLKADGTVVAVGDNRNGQCNVGDWNLLK